ncbi:sporulation protein YqfD [Clostridiaceae bacterium 14S0207]|nr:sporulation protein YqfD [Clostridiaceae bacterium 14S0207]
MNRGKIKVEITTIMPERFVNILCNEGIVLEEIKKISIVNYTFKISPNELSRINELAEEHKVRVRILDSAGMYKFKNKFFKRKAFFIGMALFIVLIYYLSNYIWVINIKTENYVSPYEIRTYLKTLGIKPGIKKEKLDIFKLENNIQEENNNVVWVRARIQGTKLGIEISERQNPPKIEEDNSPCDLVAKKDGIIERVYTKSGTAIVEEGQIVKKGDVLVRGIQGKEESTYEVKAQGDVIAKTFYENIKKVKIPKVKRIRTGRMLINRYITVKNKKIYLKNDLNKFKKYDKIEDNNSFVKKEIYYEVKEQPFTKDDEKKIIKENLLKMYSDITINFNNNIKIIKKIEDSRKEGENCKLKVLIIVEEEISEAKGNLIVKNEEGIDGNQKNENGEGQN